MKRAIKVSRPSRRPKKRAPKAPIAVIVSFLAVAFTVFLLLASVLVTAGVAAYKYYNSVVPDGIAALKSYEENPFTISLITNRNGDTLEQLYDPRYGTRKLVALKSVPKVMIDATIDTENRTFYTDIGVDPIRLLSAARIDVTQSGGLQGASTLTEQLVKLALFGSNASSARKLDQNGIETKLHEIMVAIGVTRDIKKCNLACRKNAILEMYLNTVSYGSAGGDINGVEAAAQYFFGVHASQLDLAESALLAGLPQAPSQYDPYNHREAAKERQIHVLKEMLTAGGTTGITKAQYDAAVAEPLNYKFKLTSTNASVNTDESYFVHWLRTDYLANPANLRQFGIPGLQNPEDIYRGYIFQTTLDPAWQDLAQNIIDTQVEQNRAAYNMNDGALVAIDPHSGEIRAYVGGVGWNSGINGAQYDFAGDQARQAGSSFKPFMYVTAFENGHFPAETINDAYVSYPDANGATYIPHNYDLQYHGRVTLRQALANSYNVPAVKTLYSLGPDGIKKVLKTANSMGYYLKDQNLKDLGLAMTLGTDPGRLLDEVNGYAVFANNGVYRPYMPILAIYKVQSDGSRKLVWKYKTPKGVQVIAPQFAYLITSVLSDTAAKVPAFGQYAYDYLGLGSRPVASKTGTTSDYKDNLTLGYTPDVVTGVWVGNPDDSPMPGSTGITGAAPAWHEFMYNVTQNTPISQFIMPTGILTATVARYAPAGQEPGLASSGNGVTDLFAAGTVPTTLDNPSLDDYSGSAQPGASPTASPTTTSSSTSSAPCGGGPYSITSTTKNGQTYVKLVCK